MSASIYAPDYLRNQNDKQLHLIAHMCEENVKRIHQLLEQNHKLMEENEALKSDHKALKEAVVKSKQTLLSLSESRGNFFYEDGSEDVAQDVEDSYELVCETLKGLKWVNG